MWQFPHCISRLCHHMNFFFGGKTRGGLCAQEVGTWAWIHHAQVPWGNISMISQAEKPWGVSQPGGGFPAFYTSAPQGSRFFRFNIKNFQNVTASGVGTSSTRPTHPLREILDPPLVIDRSVGQFKLFQYNSSLWLKSL